MDDNLYLSKVIWKMNKVSIVIPTYQHWNLTHQLLFDILQYNRDVDEILVINDGWQDDEILKGVEWWTSQLPQIRLYNLKENNGFLLACNKGIAKATGDIIILCSNDVRLQDDIVKLSRNLFANNPKLLVGGKLYSGSTGWNEFYYKDGTKIFPYLEGWLLIFTKDAWDNEIGPFDEQLAPCDYEDIDLSTTAIEHGYTLAPLNNDKIRHLGAQTIVYSDARQKGTERNRIKFAKKWGVRVP